MYSPWVLLDVRDSQRLLVRHDFSASSYAVQVTDFANVWTEQLDRRRIIGRALDEDTAIDPSEDSAQLGHLLQNIRAMLQSGLQGARLEVQILTTKKLHFEGTGALPKPLKDLRWPFRLSQTNSCTLATELVAPLISQGFIQHQRIERLVQELEQKDAAITKVLEKLEGTGVDLASIFPTISSHRGGRHPVTKEQVLQQVQGLKPFDPQAWQNSEKDDILSSQPLAKILDKAMADSAGHAMNRLTTQITHKITTSASDEEYDFDGDTTMTEPARPALSAAETSFNEGFQRQATPPHLAKPKEKAQTPPKQQREIKSLSNNVILPSLSRDLSYRNKEPPHNPPAAANDEDNDDEDDETTDDNDLDAPYISASARKTPAKSTSPVIEKEAPSSSPSPVQHKTKLGGLRGRHNDQPSANQDRHQQQCPNTPPEAEKSTARSPDISPPPSTKPTTRTRLGRLGRLGGTARQTQPSYVSGEEQEHGEAEPSSRNKGKSRASFSSEPGAAEQPDEIAANQFSQPDRGRPSEQKEKEEERQRETSGERADRKREELKRALAAKKSEQADGVKKRRRF